MAKWLDGCAVHGGKVVYISIDCPYCEEYIKIPGDENDREELKKRFKFCPFCGEPMDGDGNG